MIFTILRILYLRLRNNPLELLLVFVMPVLFFSIFAAIFSNGIATGGDKKLRVGWIADSPTALGHELQDFLKNHSTLNCLPLRTEPNPEESPNYRNLDTTGSIDSAAIDVMIANAQRSGRYDLIVRLPKKFPAKLSNHKAAAPCPVVLVTDGQNPMAVAVVTSVIKGFFLQQKAAFIAQQLTRTDTLGQVAGNWSGAPQGASIIEEQSVTTASDLTQYQPQYFEPMKEPFEIVARGVRYFDPLRSRDWFSEDAAGDLWLSDNPLEAPFSRRPFGALESRLTTAGDTERKPEIQYGKNAGMLPLSGMEDNVHIRVENPQAATQVNPRIAMYAAGIAVLFLLFSSTGHAAALLEESESGTLDRILISKAGLFQIIGGKWLGIFLLGCTQISVMFLWAELVFQIRLWNHLGGFAVMTLSTSAATSSFAMLIATVCKSRAQLNAVSVVVILSMSAVGGSMIPRFAMSDRMKDLGQWTFNAWALDGYQKVFWFQSPISSLQAEVTVLLGSAVVLGALALIFSLRWRFG